MDHKHLVLFLSTFTVFIWVLEAASVAGPNWEDVGCFKDNKAGGRNISLRALRNLYLSLRGNVPWGNLGSGVRQCADKAILLGYDYFAVQYWGECWSDRDANSRYNLYGSATTCKNGVGKDFTNYVYKLNCGSAYGCCPDGTTAATGPNNLGCPAETCASSNLDLVFMIDASASLNSDQFENEKQFVNDVIDSLTDLSLHVGLVRFGALAKTIFDLEEFSTIADIKNAVNNVNFTNELGTYIGYALYEANEIFKGSSRENTTKVAVLVTDGYDNHLNNQSGEYLTTMKAAMEDQDVRIICVGVGDKVNEPQLEEIATEEDSIYLVSNFKKLAAAVELIANNACKS